MGVVHGVVGVLPGNAMSIPENIDPVNQIQIPAFLAIQPNPTPVGLIAFANQAQSDGNNPTEWVAFRIWFSGRIRV